MASRKYSTISIDTTLASSINSAVGSLTVASGTGTTLMGGVTLTAGDTFALAIDPETSSEEIVYVTSVSSDTLTITRAQAGTAGIAHSAGATVQHVFTGNDAQHFEDTVVIAVTTTGSQTITGAKTFSTAPVIATITNTGTLTLPTSTDTLVGRATTDTLTNKTFTSPNTNYAVLKSPQEINTVSATAATGTINYDYKTQAVLYYTTDASGNFVVNVRGDASTTLASLMSTNNSVTVVFSVTNGATAYYNTAVQIDGTTTGVTTKWQGGTAPTAGNASSVDVYTYNITKLSSTPTYSVLASQTKFA